MKICYACQNVATTREHIPPKCIFPEQKDTEGGADLRRNLITVPSCEEHNLHKSSDDEYFWYVISLNLPANTVAQTQVSKKLTRTVMRRPALGASMLSNCIDVEVMDSHTGKVYDAVQVELDGARFDKVLRYIALGVYYHHFGERWEDGIRVHPDFIGFPGEPNEAEIDANRLVLFNSAKKLFAGEPRHGDNPDVFWYQVLEPKELLRCLIRLCFYDGCTATAFFGDI